MSSSPERNKESRGGFYIILSRQCWFMVRLLSPVWRGFDRQRQGDAGAVKHPAVDLSHLLSETDYKTVTVSSAPEESAWWHWYQTKEADHHLINRQTKCECIKTVKEPQRDASASLPETNGILVRLRSRFATSHVWIASLLLCCF